jgi:hypothetical protein
MPHAERYTDSQHLLASRRLFRRKERLHFIEVEIAYGCGGPTPVMQKDRATHQLSLKQARLRASVTRPLRSISWISMPRSSRVLQAK